MVRHDHLGPGWIPLWGRSAGEGIVYPLQCSWASLVAQLAESACNAGELGLIPEWGRPLEKGKATHSRILVWRIP